MYSTAGYLVYVRGGVLLAQPFDAERLAITGDPRPLAEPVSFVQGIDRGVFSLSRGNVLAYRARIAASDLLWFDRSGRPLGSFAASGPYLNPAISPDGTRAAVARYDAAAATSNIWIVGANRAMRQLTAVPAVNDFPVWSPDGRRLLFTSQSGGIVRLVSKDANAGAADPQQTVVETPNTTIPLDWTRDGRLALYTTFAGLGALGARFWIVPPAPAQAPIELQTEAPIKEEGQGQISPDGRWLAYVYDINGSPQVFVRPFPRGGGRWLIGSGFEPKWRGDGEELFYLAPDQMLMAVPVTTGAAFDAGDPRPLFRTALVGAYLGAPYPSARVRNEYAVSRDGQRFLINQPVDGSAAYAVRVLVNWRELLAR
jgi:dipeptidyl aminopeptidase/acylaminoacyl peptidase